MYGTVAKLQVKPGRIDALNAAGRAIAGGATPEGDLGGAVFQLDADPNVCYLVVFFESREAYQAYAASELAHQGYMKIREHLEADPEWHDGGIIHAGGVLFPEGVAVA